jgi:AcrR family transcriptional regulator
MIADATGLDGDALTELVGDKSDIYLKVMEQAYLTLKASQDVSFAEFTHDQAGVRRLADHHLDFCMTHPEVPELWIHRWLGDATDFTGMEARHLQPVLDRLTDELQDLVAPDVDLDGALWTLIWCIRGFALGSTLTPSGQLAGPRDADACRRFRRHLHLLVDRMFVTEQLTVSPATQALGRGRRAARFAVADDLPSRPTPAILLLEGPGCPWSASSSPSTWAPSSSSKAPSSDVPLMKRSDLSDRVGAADGTHCVLALSRCSRWCGPCCRSATGMCRGRRWCAGC